MQEIKKRRIVLASVLKPVNDPRMFEKMGQSLSHHYEVHIIGTNIQYRIVLTIVLFFIHSRRIQGSALIEC